jgi:hypothetical protein
MTVLPLYYHLYQEFQTKIMHIKKNKIKFAVVYNSEEHPADNDWFGFQDNYEINQHLNINERLNAFEFMISSWCQSMAASDSNSNSNSQQIENENGNENNYRDIILRDFLLILDNMKDELAVSLNTIPERFVVLYQHRIIFKSSIFEMDTTVQLQQLKQFLDNMPLIRLT